MRPVTVLLVLTLVLAALCAWAPAAIADSGSISRDAHGPQPTGDYAPLGSPPSPGLYLLNQTTIFIVGVVLLVVAAALGVYTFVTTRRAAAVR